jgi:PAS domain S-box-containing protein
MRTPIPNNEAQRLAALKRYQILDTPPEQDFDELAMLGAQICGTPAALVSLVDFDRQWFKAKVGLEATQTARDIGFCAYAVCSKELMVVPDATRDERFASSPLVTAEPRIRFYAGAPLLTSDGYALGTLCVIDRVPRELSPSQVDALRVLARQVVSQMELRRTRVGLEESLGRAQKREQELRTAEEFNTRMIECSRDCIKVLDLEGRLVSMNAGGMEILEICDFAPLRGTRWVEFWHGREREAAQSAVEAARSGGVGRFSGFCPTMGGKPMWWDVVVNAIRNEQGAPELLMAVSHDATQRVHAENSLRAAHQFTEAIIDSAAEGIVVYDRELRYVRFNAFMESLTGMRSSEVLGRVAPEVFPFLRETGIDKLLRRALEGETILLPDVLVTMPRTGREVWESNRYAPHRDAQGNIVGVIALIRDVTERKRAEERLRELVEGTAALTGSKFFHSLVRHLAAASRARYAFLASCDTTRTRARILSFWYGERFLDDQIEYNVANTPCHDVLHGRICHYSDNVQALFPKDAGLVRWQAQSYIGVPISNVEGAIIGHLAVLDIAPMPEASQALEVLKIFAARAGAELERLKAEDGLRGALVEVEELKDRLQEENVYLRRELIASVSHDLRSPLASIRGYLETLLLKGDALPPDKRHAYLEIAARQSERLGTLISELFELAKLDYSGYQINPEQVQLGELAQDVLQKFQLTAETKGIALQVEAHPDVGYVRADIALIERVLENLLENALKHTDPGGSVSLAVRRHDGRVVVDVSDTGSGIPESALPRIFDRFYQVDRSKMLDPRSAGLGLAIVKRILDLHHSQISVESVVAEGTSFSFALPAVNA